ncbi:hypothetical protein ILUMI_17186 [Ignelater luminosus]|uniref:Uncharacterized protein n=1 Tax=Ignelater luminosus TaxID=2038154 RepID=A0A8K0G598_IGNLU|nr:hypothetical protein ILUMI_17186 [Ignelater luminosus]
MKVAAEETFCVIMEKTKLNKGATSFKHAMQQMFALYYNFDLAYPRRLSQTLEFLKIYFLKIQPEQGKKSRRKHSQMKLLSLMNKLHEKKIIILVCNISGM